VSLFQYYEDGPSAGASGYLFALINLKNATALELQKYLQADDLLVENQDCLKYFKNLKIKKNIGTAIEDIEP